MLEYFRFNVRVNDDSYYNDLFCKDDIKQCIELCRTVFNSKKNRNKYKKVATIEAAAAAAAAAATTTTINRESESALHRAKSITAYITAIDLTREEDEEGDDDEEEEGTSPSLRTNDWVEGKGWIRQPDDDNVVYI